MKKIVLTRSAFFHSIWACPDGSGYPLQSFLFVPSQKEFPLLSFTRHADLATNNKLKAYYYNSAPAKQSNSRGKQFHA
jgi:hypothetical protein